MDLDLLNGAYGTKITKTVNKGIGYKKYNEYRIKIIGHKLAEIKIGKENFRPWTKKIFDNHDDYLFVFEEYTNHDGINKLVGDSSGFDIIEVN